MTQDIPALIAEARKYVSDHDIYADNHLLRDLADALEELSTSSSSESAATHE